MNDTIVGKPTPNDLQRIADQAGRFGIVGGKEVKNFTDAIEKVNKQMSDEFTGDTLKSFEKL